MYVFFFSSTEYYIFLFSSLVLALAPDAFIFQTKYSSLHIFFKALFFVLFSKLSFIYIRIFLSNPLWSVELFFNTSRACLLWSGRLLHADFQTSEIAERIFQFSSFSSSLDALTLFFLLLIILGAKFAETECSKRKHWTQEAGNSLLSGKFHFFFSSPSFTVPTLDFGFVSSSSSFIVLHVIANSIPFSFCH